MKLYKDIKILGHFLNMKMIPISQKEQAIFGMIFISNMKVMVIAIKNYK